MGVARRCRRAAQLLDGRNLDPSSRDRSSRVDIAPVHSSASGSGGGQTTSVPRAKPREPRLRSSAQPSTKNGSRLGTGSDVFEIARSGVPRDNSPGPPSSSAKRARRDTKTRASEPFVHIGISVDPPEGALRTNSSPPVGSGGGASVAAKVPTAETRTRGRAYQCSATLQPSTASNRHGTQSKNSNRGVAMAFSLSKSIVLRASAGLMLGALAACGAAPRPRDAAAEAEAPEPQGVGDASRNGRRPRRSCADAAGAKECCKGKNECKSKGACKTDTNACRARTRQGKGRLQRSLSQMNAGHWSRRRPASSERRPFCLRGAAAQMSRSMSSI